MAYNKLMGVDTLGGAGRPTTFEFSDLGLGQLCS